MTKNASFTLTNPSILGGLISEKQHHEVSPPNITEAEQEAASVWIQISNIQPGSIQPRQYFSEQKIDELATSFKERGFRGTINVRPLDNGNYELIAGERRWRAAQKAGLTKVRCIIEELSDNEALEFALIENILREDLSKLEETEGILELISQRLNISRDKIIHTIKTEGHSDKRSRSDVAPSEQLAQIEEILLFFGVGLQTFRTKNLRTLSLPEDIKKAHLEKGLSYSSAIELAKVKDEKERKKLLNKALKEELSFRDIKTLVQEVCSKTQVNPIADKWKQQANDTSNKVKKLVNKIKKAKVEENPEKQQQLTSILTTLDSTLLQLEQDLDKVLNDQ
ncbi:MAG: ParB/RepB/Spo0J family partition protein [Cyanothece sp. SIO1E1]|nr:ParB/RepB/Spo0J family partition protein [Cyanothece sp. SIO1E1]